MSTAEKKLGIAMPVVDRKTTRRSNAVPWRTAANKPIGIPSSSAKDIESKASNAVLGKVSANMDVTGRPFCW